MSLGSFWDGIYQVPMNNPPTGVKSGVQPTQIVHNSADSAMEGPAVMKYGEYYYLFFSKGQCCGLDKSRPAAGKEYRIMVCRSKVPTVGFVDKSGRACTNGGGTVVLESHGWVYGPGGQGVYQDPVHGPVCRVPVVCVLSCVLTGSGRLCTTTMLTPGLDMLMGRRSSAGISSTLQRVGQWCEVKSQVAKRLDYSSKLSKYHISKVTPAPLPTPNFKGTPHT